MFYVFHFPYIPDEMRHVVALYQRMPILRMRQNGTVEADNEGFTLENL